jgi:hypothetical protein
MSENIYSDFHIEKLKSVVTGWTINRPKIEKICLFKGCDSDEKSVVSQREQPGRSSMESCAG